MGKEHLALLRAVRADVKARLSALAREFGANSNQAWLCAGRLKDLDSVIAALAAE